MWAFARLSWLRRRTAVRSRPRWGWRARDGFWQFVQKFFGYAFTFTFSRHIYPKRLTQAINFFVSMCVPWQLTFALLTQSHRNMQIDCCSSFPGGWSQTILEVKMLDVEVLGWCGYTWSAVVRPVGFTAKFCETPLKTAYGREMNIQFTGNSSGGHSCSQQKRCVYIFGQCISKYHIRVKYRNVQPTLCCSLSWI